MMSTADHKTLAKQELRKLDQSVQVLTLGLAEWPGPLFLSLLELEDLISIPDSHYLRTVG